MLSARKRAEIQRHFRILRTSHEPRLSQMEAAVRAKMSPYRYLLIERGYEEATTEERTQLARVLKVPIDQLYPSSEAVTA